MGIFVLLFLAAGIIIAIGTLALIHGLEHPPRRSLGWALAQQLPADPGEMGLEFVEESFAFADGSKTPIWVVKGKNAQGPVVVVTHGFGDSKHGVLPMATTLSNFSSMMIFYDLRGHGDSTANISRLGTTEVEDLLAIVLEIQACRWHKQDRTALAHEATHGSRRVIPVLLFGASMGAGISIAAAAKDVSKSVVGVIAEGAYRGPTEAVAGFLRSRRWPCFPFVQLAFEHIRFWRGGYADFDRVMLAGRLKCPLLVLAGKVDPICKYESARLIAHAAPDGKIVTFTNGSHLDLASVDEARYLGALTEFFDRIKTGEKR